MAPMRQRIGWSARVSHRRSRQHHLLCPPAKWAGALASFSTQLACSRHRRRGSLRARGGEEEDRLRRCRPRVVGTGPLCQIPLAAISTRRASVARVHGPPSLAIAATEADAGVRSRAGGK
ncbi:hypothetical protein C2845_PM01G08450 [Panicum miliaceum]|uniref:Uncharacterized protein n=1 Tax=Panicum miliaceum TaxID=4540 RepID=A0A3L6TK93_PANMI|nr:hypothetical protein C2845_PM01G08450 [Panicum miliaceum]